jgi:SAM-dependent methyltransferase
MGKVFAAVYATLYPLLEPVYIKQIRRILSSRARGRVLELGVGTGLNLANIGEGVDYVGIDPEPAMLQYARRKKTGGGKTPELIVASGERLPFHDHCFDTVLSTFTFCSVSNPAQVAAEITRVLKTDGKLFFMEHVLSSKASWAKWQRRLTPCWRRVAGGCHLDRPTLETFKASGLNIVELYETAGGLLPIVWGVAQPKKNSPDLKFQVFEDHGDRGGNKNGREQVADTDSKTINVQNRNPDADDDETAGSGQFGDHPGAEIRADGAGGQGDGSLIDEYRNGGKDHPDTHSRGKNDGSNTVKHGFRKEGFSFTSQTVFY